MSALRSRAKLERETTSPISSLFEIEGLDRIAHMAPVSAYEVVVSMRSRVSSKRSSSNTNTWRMEKSTKERVNVRQTQGHVL